MPLEKINVTVSSDARSVLEAYKTKNSFGNLDSTLDALLLEFGEVKQLRQ